MLTMLLLLVGHSYSWADDQLFYTLWTVSKTGEGVQNHTNYTQYFDDEHDGMVWNAPGNQKVSDNMTDRWRIGGKSLSGVDRTITAKTPMGSAIVRVVLNHLGTSRKEVTINSLTLTVASDDAFSSIVDEVELTPTIGQGTAGSVEFVPTVTYGTQWPTAAYYKLTINLSNTSTSNGGLDLASIQFYAPAGEVIVAKPVIAPAGGTFAEPQTVTITAADECSVYYTLDGTEPSLESTLYTAPFTVSETCTVKAIAYDQEDNASSIAAAEFTILVPISSIAALCDAAPAQGDETVLVNFNKWICTGVKGNNAYFTDGANGILLYQSTHGFAVGDELTGSAQLALTTYKGCAEIKGLKSSTEGVTVTKGTGAVPLTVAISDLEKDMQGCLLYFDGLTYNATEGAFIDDDDNQIIPYRTFVELPTLENGETYNVTGVAIWFDDGKVWEIAPRTKDEIVLVASPNCKFTDTKELNLQDLEGKEIIMHEQGSVIRKVVDAFLKKNKIDMCMKYEISNSEAIKKLVENNMGMAFLTKSIVHKEIKSGELIAIPVPDKNFRRKYYMIYHSEKYFSKPLKDFRDLIMRWADIYPTISG